ncbi:MAG: acyltransferase [Lachnospiraceae bacterium]|nr:acyltransferase [Lachnospiraceae bacterium]
MASSAVKERNTSLDLIRTIAILLVIVNHAVEHTFGFDLDYMYSLPAYVRVLALAGFTLGRIGVPLFLMLTGYLLLTREYDLAGIKSFYKKNLLPLFITWEIWVLLYNIYACLYYHTGFDLKIYFKEALFLKRVEIHPTIHHTWFVPVILGIYLFIPLVAKVLHSIDWKVLLFLVLVVFVFCFVIPSANLLKLAQNTSEGGQYLSQLNLYFSGGNYGLYLIAGYCAKKKSELIQKLLRRKIICSAAILALVILFAITVAVQFYFFGKGYRYLVWYTFFTMPLIGALLFCLLAQIRPGKVLGTIVVPVSLSAFGIYLIHELIVIPAADLLGPHLGNLAEIIILTVGAFLISFILVELISRIPHVGKTLFFRKR